MTNLLSSVQFSHSVVYDSLRPHESQHARSPCPSPSPGVHSNSRPLSRWCHPTVSSSVIPFFSCLQSFPALGSFLTKLTSQFLASGGQSIGVSASASVLPMNIKDWFPLGWNDWISLLSKALSKVSQVVKNPPAMRETWVWSLGWEDPHEEEHGKESYSSTLAWRNPMDRGAWRATVHRVAKSRTQLSD